MQINRVVADRRRQQKKLRKYFWGIILLLAVYFIALGIFVFIVWSPAFRAESIIIQGNNTVSSVDIMNLLQASIIRRGNSPSAPNDGWKAMLGFHNLFIWPSALPSSTVALIPQLAGITMSKNYFTHSITVTATERQPFAVWCTPDDSCFWFDEQGAVFARTLDTEGNAFFVIHDHAQSATGSSTLTLGENVLPDEFLPNLISIVDVLRASGLNIQDTSLDDLSLQQIDVTLSNGPMLYFSLRFPSTGDLGVLQNLATQSDFSKLQYIDFTVQNRAYYK
jgi:hypothetical protein